MHNRTKTVLLLAALALTTIFVMAQDVRGPGPVINGTLDIILQINDARASYGFGAQYALCTPWPKGLDHTRPYAFAAGKNFTLIIREMAAQPVYRDRFRDYRVTARANATGFVRFPIDISGVDVTNKSVWYVAIVVEWPKPGYYFLIYNQTFEDAALIDVIGSLSGRPDRNGWKIERGPWGVIKVTHGDNRFGNLSSSVIHTYYIGVNTLGRQFSLTLSRVITVGGTVVLSEEGLAPRKGPTDYVRVRDPQITAVFGPFTYLSTYVTSLGEARKNVTIDPTRVRLEHRVFITIEGYRGEVITSENDKYDRMFGRLLYVALTLNGTVGPGTGVAVPLSCGLVVWNMPMYTVRITGLLDLKGNPVFNPESFRFKVQLKVGDGWVTVDRAQGSWRLTIGDAATAVRNVCGSLNTIGDVIECYRELGPDQFRDEVLNLYEPVVLARLGGQLKLKNDDEVRLSYEDVVSKLVVEYVYRSGQDQVGAVVLEMALAEPGHYDGRVVVSILPVQIRLWRWSNYTLPPNVPNPREFFFTDPLDLASLRFVVDGDTMYISRMAYDGAVTYDPWLGQVIWTLPPYQPVPLLVGNVRASLLSMFNASGYLPAPPLVANLTRVGDQVGVRYFDYSDAVGNAFFEKFHISIVGSYRYRFRIYSGDALVGTANVIVRYPIINSNGLLFHEHAGKALEAVGGRRDMYRVEIVHPGRFYDREHVIHIAIAIVFQNILMRDMCGRPVMGVSAGPAGAYVTLVLDVEGRSINISRLPIGSEVPVEIAIPIDEWGRPLIDLRGGMVRAYAVLHYFGYTLYTADNWTKLPATAPVYFNIPVKYGVVAKPVIYLPIAPLLFRVWSRAVSVDYDPIKEPLMGFVVRVFSTAINEEIVRGISNSSGFVYAPNVPIGVPFRVQVRTIVPGDDRLWPYHYEQLRRGNDYASYARALGFTPADTVYTLGTRGELDRGLVVNVTTINITNELVAKYVCAKDAVPLHAEVYDLVVAVYDKTGKYLLSSQPVYLGPYPQATRPYLLNVTLVLADGVYEHASIWRDYQQRDYKVITDFRAIGITGMRSIYRNLAWKYLNETQRALNCPKLDKPDYASAINAYSLASMAGFIANASTDRYAAIFTLTSQQPKDTVDVCKMTVDQVGSAEIARLFIKGQRLRFIVWYMGQKVFDDYVTITGPLVKINADVYPVNVTTYTKSMRLPVDAFVGFTITDVYLGLALNKPDARFSNASLIPQLIAPFSNTFKTYGLSRLLVNESAIVTAAPYNDKVEVLVGDSKYEYYFGQYRGVLTGGSFVYLPNLAVIRNGTVPRYLYTILTHPASFDVTYRFPIDIVVADKSFDILPNNVVVITLRGASIWSDPATNATYVRFISYNGTEGGQLVEPQLIVDASNAVIRVDGYLRKDVVLTVNANYTIELIINAKCGKVTVKPAPADITIDLVVEAGTCEAAVRYIATDRRYIYDTATVHVYPSAEYAVSFDRWFAVPYDWRYRAFNVLYRSIDVVEREGVLRTLSHVGTTTRCATFMGQIVHEEDDEYWYGLTLRGVEVVNYRTLEVVLPWRVTGGKALVNITAYFANGTKIDSIVYNLTDMLAGTRSTRAVVRLPLNFGRVGALAYHIATKDLEVRYNITFNMYDPTTRPHTVCATKLVPLAAEYATVSMYDCMEMRPGAPEIDPQTTVYRINMERSVANGFRETFDRYGGFGTPITYVVKAGDIALLPSWYHKTSVAGSRIARIWIIAAGEQPCGTPALGTRYSFTEVKDDKVTLKLYKFNKYLVVNFVPNVCPAGVTTRTYLDEFDGEGRIVGLGFGTSGTSALVISNYTGVQMWNSTAMWLAGGAFKLPTVALDRLTVRNDAEFPIYVSALIINMSKCTYEVPADLVRVNSKSLDTTLLNGYGFGRTYMMNITDVWAFRLVQPNYRYSLKAYHAGVVDAANYFGLVDRLDKAEILKILNHLSPLPAAEFVQNVLYASHAPDREWTYRILFGKIREVTRGTWSNLVVNSSDWDYKYVFSFPTLRLREIRDWNDRPLANQTVVLFADGKPYAIVYTNSSGKLEPPPPDLRDPSQIVRVSWYYGYLFELLRGRPEFTIWIYDQSIERDRIELGNGTVVDKIRTYVYPLTITVRDAAGRPLTNMIVQVIDTSTNGRLVNAANKTGADGGAQVVDLRISKYATGVLSQVPATSYIYRVFDENGALVAVGRFEIQRGAAVPAQGWNIIATVQYVTDIPVRNSATRGYLLIRNVEFIDGSRRDVEVPFTISNGVMRLQGKVPVTIDYPVEIYITHVTLGNVEVPVRGGKVLVFSGRTGDLLAGLDFAELGVTGTVTIQAVDTSGAPRSDWTVQVLYRNITVVQGGGQVQVVLPRTDLLDAPYNVRVITNAITPAGTALVKEQTFEVRQRSQSLQIPVSTVKATVQAVDGFGNLRSDWPITIVNVASGTGQVAVELVEGERYTVRVTGLGYTNETVITARGRQMTVAVKVPTAKISAQVVDGFDRVRSDWPIEIVNVVAASGSTGDVEVIAGCYNVKSAVFGKEFTDTVCVKSGEVKTATIKVPTAKLSITVVDDDRRPIDRYVTSVELIGPITIMSATPPKDLEVLAGSYKVKINVFGRPWPERPEDPFEITLRPGESKNIEIVVQGTAGLDFMGTRIPLPTLVLYALLLLVVVAILVILMIEYNNWRRRRLMQILAPPK